MLDATCQVDCGKHSRASSAHTLSILAPACAVRLLTQSAPLILGPITATAANAKPLAFLLQLEGESPNCETETVMTGSVPLAFNETADLATNLGAFAHHAASLHPLLGPALAARLDEILRGDYERDTLLDALFVSADQNAPAASTAATAQSSQPATTHPVPVTGWLIEGISVEGFRGINNENKPLELKFRTDKINSISAVNGVGKSSLYDALRFAVTGKLDWLERLPASERGGDYYLNKFNKAGKATITLRLVAEPSLTKCVVTVTRDAQQLRTISATGGFDAKTVLRDLNREFVMLDGPTFQSFMTSTPVDRGRIFAGLLGLSSYSTLRRELAGIANTRAFNNHFATTAHEKRRDELKKTLATNGAKISAEYQTLVGKPLTNADDAAAPAICLAALAQIGPLTALCAGVAFDAVDIAACHDAIQQAEGGPQRTRLIEVMQARAALTTKVALIPTADQAKELVARAGARDAALAKTRGETMLALLRAGQNVMSESTWADPDRCPLCDTRDVAHLAQHLTEKLAEFADLDNATLAVGREWRDGGWVHVQDLESALEPSSDNRLIAKTNTRAAAGSLSQAEAETLAIWVETLRTRAAADDATLAADQAAIEVTLPPSMAEATKKVEAARQLQSAWRDRSAESVKLAAETKREATVAGLKNFLDEAADAFGKAETNISKARLAGVEPVFKNFFAKMSFAGVVPTVSKPDGAEDLDIRLADFFGLKDQSPRALLSESFRNAYAVSLYLAAASLYGGLPKFIILDDVTSSFDAGHQHFLVELLRTSFARPAKAAGPQIILLSHDTMLEKLFNKHSNTGGWWHQRLEGAPQTAVLPQAGAVNAVRDVTKSMLNAGQVDFAKEGVRQYLEYRLSDVISRLRIPVPLDVAFNDNKQLASEFINAIEAQVKLHKAAGDLVLDSTQETSLNTNMVTIVGNFLSHWSTGQTLSFTAHALLGVMQAIDDYCECFTHEPSPGAARVFYKSLSQK